MPIGHLLEDYSDFNSGSPVTLTDISLEERRLAAFEAGYQAGWDDSLKAQAEDTMRVSSELAQNLHELSFTYQEAYSGILNALAPLLKEMVDTVLPQAARETLGSRVTEMLFELSQELGKQPVEIVTAPSNMVAIEEMIAKDVPLPVTVKGEISLGEGQVFVRVGGTEREVNLSEVLAEIDRAVTGFFEENQKDIA